ncbi:MAG: alpha-L-arabinofuranosidase C-terminal domain-containing protein [Tepidisphaerales bacterium]
MLGRTLALSLALGSCALFGSAFAADAPPARPATISIQADKPGHEISPVLWGIFFEDINLSADGGVYAELVRNRSFEDSDKPEHWTLLAKGSGTGDIAINKEKPLAADPAKTRNLRSLRLHIESASPDAPVGAANEGYWGVPVKQGEQYDLSFYARVADGYKAPLLVTLEGADGKVYAKDTVSGVGEDWKQFKLTLKPDGSDKKARLVISGTAAGTVFLDVVSLFPRTTWKGHGLRPDLMEMLAGLKPAFVRFPGGCWVEGDTMKEAYRWKQTIGDIAERRTQWNIWQYWATHGLGYHEYLQMCEDLGSEPLFVINVGMSHKENVPMDKMDEFVQDALDAIEYANGPADSKWGAVRAKAGHPAAFNLKYMEIGNENGGRAYQERYPLFVKAIKDKYPSMHLIANEWGGIPKDAPVEIVDEHYYNTPEFFMQQAGKYDKYKRDGYKVYVGEYAVTQNGGKGNLRAAVGEAVFMTGMERNSDVVTMASYAPLFVHLNHRKWNPDLINYDNSAAYGIPGYYVQQLFGQNRGDVVLPCEVDAPPVQQQDRGGAIGVGTWLTQAEYKDIKVVSGDTVLFESNFADGTPGWRLHGGQWQAEDGVLRQSSNNENIRAIFGDKKWTDYTLTLKARKISGAEGFLILFNVQDDGAKSWWNIGGWGNKRHAIEMAGVTDASVNGVIETNKWYDIRIENKGSSIKCFLDGKLIHDVQTLGMKGLYASAALDKKANQVIVKVVNTGARPQETTVNLAGIASLKSPAKALVLTSEKSTDENSLEEPTKVAPKEKSIDISDSSIKYAVPGNSVTVIRVQM